MGIGMKRNVLGWGKFKSYSRKELKTGSESDTKARERNGKNGYVINPKLLQTK